MESGDKTEKTDNHEVDSIAQQYARRKITVEPDRYDPTKPSVYLPQQERHRALIRLIKKYLQCAVADCRVIEVGCGTGGNLLELLQLGFSTRNIVANELLDERLNVARERLPEGITLIGGDARKLGIKKESFDIVMQSTVFSSILDENVQEELAQKMWQWVVPGGGVLWYDFTYNNPTNPDVRGVKIKRIRELFPEGNMIIKHVTLAPPISRRVCQLHPNMYHIFNAVPLLRTHVLCWIGKRS
jgi:ubiquinone/menaquinone biosynthesis C-methylase UbiE